MPSSDPPESYDETEFEHPLMRVLQVDDLENFRLFRKMKEHVRLMTQLTGINTEEGHLTAARMRLLTRLAIDNQHGGDGLSPSELSRFLEVSRNTVSALLNRLEDQGLVERHVHTADKRQFRIRLTPAGQSIFEAHAPDFAAFLKHIYSPLTPDERRALYRLMDKLNTGLKEAIQDQSLHIPGEESTS